MRGRRACETPRCVVAATVNAVPTTDTSHDAAAPDAIPAEHGHEREPDGPPVHTVEVHPEWCSPVLCYRTEEGVRVHMQAPACWEQDELTRTQFKTGLLGPEDGPFTYLELELRSLLGSVHAILPLGDARRFRDQLSAHLDAAESGRRNRVEGVDGQLLTTCAEGGTADGAGGA